MQSTALAAALVLALGAAAAGCGGDDAPSAGTTAPAPVTGTTTPTSPPATTPQAEPAPPTPDLSGLEASDAALIDGYLGWTELTTPPVASLRALGSAHGGDKRIFASPPADELRSGGAQRFPYPRDTVIVKEGRRGGALTLIAIMEKVRANDADRGGWRYAEYMRPGGGQAFAKVGFSEAGCAGCHQNANSTQKTDWVFYSLP